MGGELSGTLTCPGALAGVLSLAGPTAEAISPLCQLGGSRHLCSFQSLEGPMSSLGLLMGLISFLTS